MICATDERKIRLDISCELSASRQFTLNAKPYFLKKTHPETKKLEKMPLPEKLKSRLLTPSWTWMETDGQTGNTICPFHHSSSGDESGVLLGALRVKHCKLA